MSTLVAACFSTSAANFRSLLVTSEVTRPFCCCPSLYPTPLTHAAPQCQLMSYLPIRPARCTYCTRVWGKSKLTTCSTCTPPSEQLPHTAHCTPAMSSPRAARSVHTSTDTLGPSRLLPLANRSQADARIALGIPPCRPGARSSESSSLLPLRACGGEPGFVQMVLHCATALDRVTEHHCLVLLHRHNLQAAAAVYGAAGAGAWCSLVLGLGCCWCLVQLLHLSAMCGALYGVVEGAVD